MCYHVTTPCKLRSAWVRDNVAEASFIRIIKISHSHSVQVCESYHHWETLLATALKQWRLFPGCVQYEKYLSSKDLIQHTTFKKRVYLRVSKKHFMKEVLIKGGWLWIRVSSAPTARPEAASWIDMLAYYCIHKKKHRQHICNTMLKN